MKEVGRESGGQKRLTGDAAKSELICPISSW